MLGGDSMRDRIKQLRKAQGLNQTEFGDKLGVSKDVVYNIESGRVNPTEMQIRLICRTFPVSEVWLRTGEGEMLQPISADEQIAAYVGEVLQDAPDSFRKRLLASQANWTPEMWEALERICESLK